MSPLVVSQLLPTKTYFDVVIFDEASQITPADAISSILRGKQLVVAGDDETAPADCVLRL
jgi:superfamily I DNA and/or RNA helicase